MGDTLSTTNFKRSMQFFIFFAIVIGIYVLVNMYIFRKGLRSFDPGSKLRLIYGISFWLLAASFILGRILEKLYMSYLSDLFVWAGSFWLAAMLYFFLIVLFFDLLRLIDHFIPFLKYLQYVGLFAKPLFLPILVSVIVFLLVLAGHINAIYPVVQTLDIASEKIPSSQPPLRIILASDIHLGTIVGKKRVSRIVRLINQQQPDVILLAGDIVDEDLEPVIKQNLGEILSTLHAPLGVIGISGNHEYIGGAEAALTYLRSHGVVMLEDQLYPLTDHITLVGRTDLSARQYDGKARKSLAELLDKLSQDQFVLVMDHQPAAIPEAVKSGVNLIVSGHTHHGQLWPLNLITNAVYPISWGYAMLDQTHAYVSCGVGSWGPPVRIGNRPEIVLINLRPETDTYDTKEAQSMHSKPLSNP
ncbi:MAG: metallophosphoesterase [Bacteroidales bacterium]|jgi:predicted MPP superfamily phosphohydrolase|nr:metallophosphoesterase [Bacteroidales bacterium]